MVNDSGIRKKILIVDDFEVNRKMLVNMLRDEYEIFEARNGIDALSVIGDNVNALSLVLLDTVMPGLDGIGVLRQMKRNGWINKIPVIMISAQNELTYAEQAFSLGASEFVRSPFNTFLVRRRVANTLLLHKKPGKYVEVDTEKFNKTEKPSCIMSEAYRHIVEFRHSESAGHVRHVRILTKIFLNCLSQGDYPYHFDSLDIFVISLASSLHDIGKIAIQDEILSKADALTDEEYAIIKTHPEIGEKMLNDLNAGSESLFVKYARQICRWHHERYDGGGYPDGLKGDDIPIAAQVVALADVYDALISDRAYKKPITHSEAVSMIIDGRCGAFNPLLIKCLSEVQDQIENLLKNEENDVYKEILDSQYGIEKILGSSDVSGTETRFNNKSGPWSKNDYFASLTNEIQFDYKFSTSSLRLSHFGAQILGVDETVANPFENDKIRIMLGVDNIRGIGAEIANTTSSQPEAIYICEVNIGGEKRWTRIYLRSIWSEDDPQEITGIIGKTVDIHDAMMKVENLRKMASSDSMTGLLNHDGAKRLIVESLENHPEKNYAMFIFDLDDFKAFNDNYGHRFGDEVLIHIAQRLRKVMRNIDICARIGGDEFLAFFEYSGDIEPIIERIFSKLNLMEYNNSKILLSMGVTVTKTTGRNYDDLLVCADKALYTVKRSGSGRYCFYDKSMKEIFSAFSPIDDEDSDDVL